MLKIYDTMAREKRPFIPVNEGKVNMYVCGPTVYNYIHIGNARTFISFDTIRRYLIWRGYEVKFVQNITDVDDKIIKKANEEGRSAAEVAAEYAQAFIDDMNAAGVMEPDVRPRATEEIGEMIALVKKLIEEGHAYAVEGDVYFAVRSYEKYGQLSNRNVDEMETGHRELRADGQGLEDRKRDPLDFALWKAAKPGEPSWESPWGQGRPGWHIECSAMSEKYLGLPFDIHGGGADLAFPHHENERAQSEAACGCTFANYWIHGGMLQINHEKMSKSLGNFLLLRDILKTTDPRTLRMLMLQTHYRSPLDFSDERLGEAESALGRLANFVKNTEWLCQNAAEDTVDFDAAAYKAAMDAMCDAFIDAMDDDFNTAGALGAVFGFVSEANTMLNNGTVGQDVAEQVRTGAAMVSDLLGVLGVALEAAQGGNGEEDAAVIELAAELAGFTGDTTEAAIEHLLARRAEARKEKNFALADAVRDRLGQIGYVVEDTPQGARVSRS